MTTAKKWKELFDADEWEKRIRSEGYCAGIDAAAQWHDAQCQGGHCGESASELIIRQRRNAWHKEAASAIRRLITENVVRCLRERK